MGGGWGVVLLSVPVCVNLCWELLLQVAEFSGLSPCVQMHEWLHNCSLCVCVCCVCVCARVCDRSANIMQTRLRRHLFPQAHV